MKQITILRYAYRGLYEVWEKAYDKYYENPNNKAAKARYESLDRDLEELKEVIREEELKMEGN